MEMRCYRKILRISYKTMLPTRKSVPRSNRQSDHTESSIVKRRKLQWYGHVSRSSDLTKAILQGTVKGGRRRDKQKKRWEDNIREWTGLVCQVPEGSGEQRKMEETGCEIICGASTTPAIKGLMMMMMMMIRFSSAFTSAIFKRNNWDILCLDNPRREAGDVRCLPPVWNLRAVI